MTNLLDLVRRTFRRDESRRFDSYDEIERTIGFSRIVSQVRPLVDGLDVPEERIYHYLLDVFFDSGVLYAIIITQGRLFRADIRIGNDDSISLGNPVAVTQMFVPSVSRSFQSMRVFRTANGRARWLSISNTAILNREGELDSRALFDSFVQHAEQTGEYPYRTFHHQGEVLRTGQADFLARDGYVYITSGLYNDSDLAKLEQLALANNPDRWGESIGFSPTAPPTIERVGSDFSFPVYEEGVNTEISLCLEELASAWFTVPQIPNLEVTRMNELVTQSLRALLVDAGVPEAEIQTRLDEFGGLVDGVNERVADGATIARATIARAAAAGNENQVVDADAVESEELVIDDSVIDAIIARMAASNQEEVNDEAGVSALEQMAQTVDDLVVRVAAIESTATENFATIVEELDEARRALTVETQRTAALPPQTATHVVYRPSAPSRAETPGDVAGSGARAANGLDRIPKYAGVDS